MFSICLNAECKQGLEEYSTDGVKNAVNLLWWISKINNSKKMP
jgi:hypothetical protein